jgi:hypothetical protein
MLKLLLRELKEEPRGLNRRLKLEASGDKFESIDLDGSSSLPTGGIVCLVRW